MDKELGTELVRVVGPGADADNADTVGILVSENAFLELDVGGRDERVLDAGDLAKAAAELSAVVPDDLVPGADGPVYLATAHRLAVADVGLVCRGRDLATDLHPEVADVGLAFLGHGLATDLHPEVVDADLACRVRDLATVRHRPEAVDVGLAFLGRGRAVVAELARALVGAVQVPELEPMAAALAGAASMVAVHPVHRDLLVRPVPPVSARMPAASRS